MPSKIVLILIASGLFVAGCNSKRIASLEHANDSLRNELQLRSFESSGMHQVRLLLDSIDINRKLLREDISDVTSTEELTTRLTDINNYVKRSEKKIETIEQQLRRSRNEASAYTMMVNAMKGEVEIRDGEIIHLASSVSDSEESNRTLMDSVRYHEKKATGLHNSITEKQKQLALLESKVHSLENDFRLTEAEVYYAKGRLLEDAARRTILAAQKKKQILTEALELYRRAYALGKQEAKRNIELIEENMTTRLSSGNTNQVSVNE